MKLLAIAFAVAALSAAARADEMKPVGQPKPAIDAAYPPAKGARKADSAADAKLKIIKVTAKKFEYDPAEIKLKKGEPVILEFTALDFDHGFIVPDFLVAGKPFRADLKKGSTVRVKFTADKIGRFTFRCDNFCGLHHEDMEGAFVVE